MTEQEAGKLHAFDILAKVAREYRNKEINQFGVLIDAKVFADFAEEVLDEWA